MTREIKFEYIFQCEQTSQIKKQVFTLEELEGIDMESYLENLDENLYRDSLHEQEEGEVWKIIQRRQSTGLLDKNGKKIYESDILRVLNYKSSGKIVYTTHIVRYSDSYAIFYAQNIDNPEGYGPMGSPLLFLLMGKDCEIIGSIYENPELLTK